MRPRDKRLFGGDSASDRGREARRGGRIERQEQLGIDGLELHQHQPSGRLDDINPREQQR